MRNHRFPRTLAAVIAAVMAGGYARSASAAWALNMTRGVTEVSREVYDLHMLILIICTVVGIGVFGAMVYAILTFRKSRGAVADKHLTHSTTAEIIWTAAPTIVLIFMAYKAAPALIHIEDNRNAEMTLKITGYQWKWQYEYVGQDYSFFSTLASSSNETRQLNSGKNPHDVANYLLEVDHELVLPVGTKIRYLLTANDVLHAWWVPAFAVKRDAVPGYINEGWFTIDQPGTYRGQCAELCGKDHGFMPIVVKAVPKAEFDTWLKQQKDARSAST